MFVNQKVKNRDTTAKIAVWYTISNFFVKGFGLISAPIFTRLLTKGEIGEFSNYTSWESIFTIIISLQLGATLLRAKYDFKDNIKEYVTTITFIGNVVALIWIILVEINPQLWSDMLDMDISFIRIMYISMLWNPAFAIIQTEHRMFNKYKMFVVLSVGSALIRTIMSIVLVMNMQNRLIGRLVGYVAPVAIIDFCVWIYIWIRNRSIRIYQIRYAIGLAVPLVINALANTILSTSDRIMIRKMVGAEENALYTIAYTAATFVSVIWTSMNQAWSPWLFDRLNENNHSLIREKTNWYLGAFCIVVIPFIFLAPDIIFFIGGKAYMEVVYLVPPVMISFVCQFIYGLYINIELYEKKVWFTMIGTILAAVINVALNWLLIPIYGYSVAAYTTLIGYCCLMLFHYLVVCGFKKYSSIYDIRFILMMLVLFACINAGAAWIYEHNIIRYFALALYVITGTVLLIKKKKYILEKLSF